MVRFTKPGTIANKAAAVTPTSSARFDSDDAFVPFPDFLKASYANKYTIRTVLAAINGDMYKQICLNVICDPSIDVKLYNLVVKYINPG